MKMKNLILSYAQGYFWVPPRPKQQLQNFELICFTNLAMGHTLKIIKTVSMRKICIYMIENSFSGIQDLKRGITTFDQIFSTKMGMNHILRENFHCFNAENVCLHHEKRGFSAILTNFDQFGVFLGISMAQIVASKFWAYFLQQFGHGAYSKKE